MVMQISSLEPRVQTIVIDSINAYQKYISPRKGFSCPHRVLYGSESCSDYVKRMLTEQRLASALKLSVQRFKNCANANKTITANKTANGFGCIVLPCCLPL
jgi:putative component of membrane protein insertase Oxa1/YidC/SpoIIIJ protein YidD